MTAIDFGYPSRDELTRRALSILGEENIETAFEKACCENKWATASVLLAAVPLSSPQ